MVLMKSIDIQDINGPWGEDLEINGLPIFLHYRLKINNKYYIYYISYPVKESECSLNRGCSHWQVGTGKKTTGLIETNDKWEL